MARAIFYWFYIIIVGLGVYFLTTQTDQYQIGKIVKTHARNYAKQNAIRLDGIHIHLLKDGVAILFSDPLEGANEKTQASF